MSTRETIGEDLIWGTKAIAQEINRTDRQTFHMLATGAIPATKIGGRWCAMRSALRTRIATWVDGGVQHGR